MTQANKEHIYEIISDHLGVPKQAVSDNKSFPNDLGADYLTITELVMAIEEEFCAEIGDDIDTAIDEGEIYFVRDLIAMLDPYLD